MLCMLLMQMLGRAPILVVAKSPTAETLIRELRQLTRIAVAIDSCESALEMMEVVNFGLVIVEIRDDADWCTCRRIVSAARAPVAVVTRCLARNRHFREFAFRMGVAAYIAVPCTPVRLRALLRHIEAGRGGIELVRGAAYCEG